MVYVDGERIRDAIVQPGESLAFEVAFTPLVVKSMRGGAGIACGEPSGHNRVDLHGTAVACVGRCS
jgi:hypothetical protein